MTMNRSIMVVLVTMATMATVEVEVAVMVMVMVMVMASVQAQATIMAAITDGRTTTTMMMTDLRHRPAVAAVIQGLAPLSPAIQDRARV